MSIKAFSFVVYFVTLITSVHKFVAFIRNKGSNIINLVRNTDNFFTKFCFVLFIYIYYVVFIYYNIFDRALIFFKYSPL